MICVYVFTVLIIFGGCFGDLGCRNENGDVVDWFMLYKFPSGDTSNNPLEGAGEMYAYLDAKKGVWDGAAKSVENTHTFMANTYNQIINDKKKLAYLIYNDQMPGSDSSSTYYGHTKGILATDGKDGFWLVHSVPRFPNKPKDGTYDYPDNGKRNGQSLLCITFPVDQLAKIVNVFRYTHPRIYSKHIINNLPLPDDLKKFFVGRPRLIRSPPWNITTEIKSKGGQSFTVFGKHRRFAHDLYDGLVAPMLNSSLYVQSWHIGGGGKLGPDCVGKFKVYNVEEMNFKDLSVDFITTSDHSKWAASVSETNPWACVGDINRMHSQFKRGGGTVCLKSKPAWKAYTFAIADIEGCLLKYG